MTSSHPGQGSSFCLPQVFPGAVLEEPLEASAGADWGEILQSLDVLAARLLLGVTQDAGDALGSPAQPGNPELDLLPP